MRWPSGRSVRPWFSERADDNSAYPRLADELYYTARAFRIFTTERRQIAADSILPLLALGAGALRVRLEGSAALLG